MSYAMLLILRRSINKHVAIKICMNKKSKHDVGWLQTRKDLYCIILLHFAFLLPIPFL